MSASEEAVDTQTEEQEVKKLTLDMKVESPSTCQRHVTVTVSKEDVDRYFDNAFQEMMPTASVPGFRPGNAPRKLVEKRFRSEVSNQVKGSLLMDSMAQASDDQDFSAISEPDFDYEAVELPEDGPLTFEFDIEVRPEFDLPKWKGLSLEKPTQKFDKEAIDKHLLQVLGRYGQLVPRDDAAEEEDHLICNLSFTKDGEELSSMEEESICLRPTLSFQDTRWEEFGAELTGAKAGDKKTATLKISDEAENEALRGQEVEMEIEVLEVKRMELPEMDEAFLKTIGNFESEGDLRDYVKDDMERQFDYHQQNKLRQQITETLTSAADWDLPPELLKRQSKRELDRAVLELRSAGFDEDAIRAHENELRQNSMASTERALKEHFILERIAEEEKVEDAAEDYDLEILRIAAQSNEPPRRVRARLEKQGMMDALRNQIIERKVIDLINEAAEFTEIDSDTKKTDVSAVNHAVGGIENEIPDVETAGEPAEKK
ncbi:MAG: trigger factor [Pirellulales bacterium]